MEQTMEQIDKYEETLELIKRVEPFCRDRIGQIVALDKVIHHVGADLITMACNEVDAIITNKVI